MDSKARTEQKQGRSESRRGWFAVRRDALEKLSKLSAISIRVFLELASMADADGICWPSAATLAKLIGVNRKSIYRAVAAIEEAGLIERFSGKGCRESNTYRIAAQQLPNGDKAVPINPLNGDKSVTISALNRDKFVTRIGTNLSLNGDKSVPPMRTMNKNHEQQEEEESDQRSLCDDADASPPANDQRCFVFALQNGVYRLPAAKLAEYQSTYPFDVEAELRKAAQWLRDNKSRRPRSNCKAFLTRWLNRTSDRDGNGMSGDVRAKVQQALSRIKE